jgi:hypothetical protein
MRRGDPERKHIAQRAGIFARLAQNERLDELEGEHLIRRWEREAETRGLAHGHTFWEAGWEWITEQRLARSSREASSD